MKPPITLNIQSLIGNLIIVGEDVNGDQIKQKVEEALQKAITIVQESQDVEIDVNVAERPVANPKN